MSNNELIILKYFILYINIYNKYNIYINKEYIKNNYKDLYKIYSFLEYLYSNDDVDLHLTIQDFAARFFAAYPALKKAERELYQSIFQQLESIDVSQETVDTLLEAHRKRAIASELAQIAWEISEGKREFLELPGAFERLADELDVSLSDDIPYVSDDLKELLTDTYSRPGIKFPLLSLRRMAGSLRKGDFGVIFARPEVGKTTLLAHILTYAVPQVDRPIIFFTNEEYGPKIKIRFFQAAFGVTLRELMDNEEEYARLYKENFAGRLKILDSEVLEKSRVEAICKKEIPSFIVIDSIDKVSGFVEDRDDLQYKKIYQWARELAKKYGPVVGVCHASVSGENKKWLEMGDVAYAKTAKQGECDWILGIGQTFTPGEENIRFLHFCKNKLLGDEDSREDLRHGRLPVRILPEISRYEDMIDKDE